MKLHELRQKRAKHLADARAIHAKAEAEDRDINTEERSEFERLMGLYKTVGDVIAREETLEREERAMETLISEQVDATQQRGGTNAETDQAEREVRDFCHYLQTGERRALQVDSNVSGGYLVTPQQMVARLIQAVDNAVHIRSRATRFQVPNAVSLGVPTLSSDPDDPEWTSEIATGNTDSSMAFGKRQLHPRPVATKMLVSETLLRMVPNVESLVRARLAYKMGLKHENAFLNGSGDGQPLGVFTANAQGISTGRDVSTGNTATALTVDGLKRAKGALKSAYRNSGSCAWLFHRDVVTEIALLKDGNGRYLLQDAITAGEPERLLGIPMVESEYAPNTMTASQYVGILGDWSHYWIADALDVRIQRLVELYAASNQVGFHVRSETDGMPVLEEAFVRVKLGS